MNAAIARTPSFISIGEVFGIRHSVLLLFLQKSQMTRAAKAVETAKHPIKHYTDTGIEQALQKQLDNAKSIYYIPIYKYKETSDEILS